MFFKSPWANLALIAVLAAVVTLVIVHLVKVVDANGKDGGLSLSIMPSSTATLKQVYS